MSIEKAVKRAFELLNVAANHCEQYASESETFYDETMCDGSCIAEDCRNAAIELDYQLKVATQTEQPVEQPLDVEALISRIEAWNGDSPDMLKSCAIDLVREYQRYSKREMVTSWNKGLPPKQTGVQYMVACQDVWVCPAEWTGDKWHIHNITLFPDTDIIAEEITHWMHMPFPETTQIEVEPQP